MPMQPLQLNLTPKREETFINDSPFQNLTSPQILKVGFDAQIESNQPLTQQLHIIDKPTHFKAPVVFEQLIQYPISKVQPNTSELNVLNQTRFTFDNSSPTLIESITHGQEGQMIILQGDGNTTLEDNAKIVCGTNTLLQPDTLYFLVQFNNKWILYGSVGTSYSAGDGINIVSNTINNLYTGKVVSQSLANLTHTAVFNFTDEIIHSGNYSLILDLTNMTKYRIHLYNKLSSYPFDFKLAYSTNDSSWSFDSNSISPISNSKETSSWFTLPIPARIADCYISIGISGPISETVEVGNFSLEFKP
jgi:hypothetical protein